MLYCAETLHRRAFDLCWYARRGGHPHRPAGAGFDAHPIQRGAADPAGAVGRTPCALRCAESPPNGPCWLVTGANGETEAWARALGQARAAEAWARAAEQ